MASRKNTLQIINRLPPYLLVLSALYVLLTFTGLGQFTHPSADDFCMATGIRHEGLLTHLWNHYFEWSGRYSGNAFYAIYPLVFGMFDGLILVPGLLILLLWLSCGYFLSRLFRMSLFARPVLLVSLVFVCVYLLGMKHTASSLFWPSGALSYQTANILFLLTLGLILQLRGLQQQQKSYTKQLFSLTIVVILGMGSNETTMLALTATVALALLMQWRAPWVIARPWIFILLVTLFCFAIVYFAPGNAIREAAFPLRHDLPRALKGSLDMGLWVLAGWLLNPLFIVASLLTPFAVSRLYSISSRFITLSTSLIVFLVLVTLLIPFVLQFPAWWAMGGWPPPRTVDAIFFIFMLSWFITLGAITLYFNPRFLLVTENQQHRAGAVYFLLAGAITFSFAIAGSYKFQRAQSDLWQRAEPFHQYMLSRYELIDEAVSNQHFSLLLPAYHQQFPRSIYFNDIVSDARDWRNICYADYFGLQQVSRQRQQNKSDHKMRRPRPDQY